MRALDYLEPLPLLEACQSLRNAMPSLAAGTPVAFRAGAEWRLVTPADGLAYPLERQLRDLPNRTLPMLSLADDVDVARIATTEVWGATKRGNLVGRIDRSRVLSTVAELFGRGDAARLDAEARDRVMPKLLHDLANALVVAQVSQLEPDERSAGDEALRHAAALVTHMRGLYLAERSERERPLELGPILLEMEPMLRTAAAPAALTLRVRTDASIRGLRWRVESAVLNLVLNAGEHGKRVRVTVRDERSRVAIDVEDDGPGFVDPAEDDDETPSPLRGHGLASVRRQAGALGGRLALGHADEALGGALASLRLPRIHES